MQTGCFFSYTLHINVCNNSFLRCGFETAVFSLLYISFIPQVICCLTVGNCEVCLFFWQSMHGALTFWTLCFQSQLTPACSEHFRCSLHAGEVCRVESLKWCDQVAHDLGFRRQSPLKVETWRFHLAAAQFGIIWTSFWFSSQSSRMFKPSPESCGVFCLDLWPICQTFSECFLYIKWMLYMHPCMLDCHFCRRCHQAFVKLDLLRISLSSAVC